MINSSAVANMLLYLTGTAGMTMLDIALRLQVTESAVYRWSTGGRIPQRRNRRGLERLYNRIRSKIEASRNGGI